MDELPKEARALLDAAAAADDPTHVERERADAAVRAVLSAHGVQLPPLARPAPVDARLSRAGKTAATSASTVKIGIGVVVLCAGAWLGVRVSERGRQPAPPAPASQTSAADPRDALPHRREPEPASPAIDLTPVQPAPSSRPNPRRKAEPGNTIDAEVRMIAEANALLRAEHFDAALSKLALHARLFPHGTLREERAALHVLSLCGKGPRDQALRERERFLRTAPQSVLAARVSAACAERGARTP